MSRRPMQKLKCVGQAINDKLTICLLYHSLVDCTCLVSFPGKKTYNAAQVKEDLTFNSSQCYSLRVDLDGA